MKPRRQRMGASPSGIPTLRTFGSAMVVDGNVMIGDEDGELTIFAEGRQEKKLKKIEFNSSIYSTPTVANGVIFITDRSRLYAFKAF